MNLWKTALAIAVTLVLCQSGFIAAKKKTGIAFHSVREVITSQRFEIRTDNQYRP